jgi:hypothetical protein
LHKLIGEEEGNGDETAAVAYNNSSCVLLEDLVKEGNQVERDVEDEKSVLPPSRIAPLKVDQVPQ